MVCLGSISCHDLAFVYLRLQEFSESVNHKQREMFSLAKGFCRAKFWPLDEVCVLEGGPFWRSLGRSFLAKVSGWFCWDIQSKNQEWGHSEQKSGVALANQTKESEVRELSGKESGMSSGTPL